MSQDLSHYDTLFNAASALPVDQRVRLIGALSDTVPGDAADEISSEWTPQLREKIAEGERQIERGDVVSHEEAKKRLAKWLD